MSKDRVWTCQRVTDKTKCGHRNPNRKQICERCGKRRPPRKKAAHLSALRLPMSYYVKVNGGPDCGICGKSAKPGEKFHRDHEHAGVGFARGVLCFRCNSALRPYMTVVWVRAALGYLERAEARRVGGSGGFDGQRSGRDGGDGGDEMKRYEALPDPPSTLVMGDHLFERGFNVDQVRRDYVARAVEVVPAEQLQGAVSFVEGLLRLEHVNAADSIVNAIGRDARAFLASINHRGGQSAASRAQEPTP